MHHFQGKIKKIWKGAQLPSQTSPPTDDRDTLCPNPTHLWPPSPTTWSPIAKNERSLFTSRWPLYALASILQKSTLPDKYFRSLERTSSSSSGVLKLPGSRQQIEQWCSCVLRSVSDWYKYKYNERFVRRRSTNRPGALYNNNNKSVRTIKQNSFKSSLEYVSVSNVM